MNAQQKIKHLILALQAKWNDDDPPFVTEENIDEMYELAVENDDGSLQDARNDIRASGIETGLSAPFSRHYEGDAVAAKAMDGSWVGWTYWHGGGKHGEPDAIEWIEDAYDLNCVSEEKLVVVRTFTKPEATRKQA